ncbi:MAG: hypothetical protein WC314_04165 [Vulcanimicrobiota bacterium]
MKRVYPYLVGFWLACLQTSLFFVLQISLSSAFLSYGVLLFGWLLGSAVGVSLTPRQARLWLVVSALCPYGLYGVLHFFPYRLEALPLVGLLIVLCSIFAGVFFQAEKSRFEKIGRLLFWETAGFCSGLVAALAVLLFLGGLTLAAWSPAGGLLLLVFHRR